MRVTLNRRDLIALLLFHLLVASLAYAEQRPLMRPYPPNFPSQNFVLFDTFDNKRELTDFRGKYVLINFWASSCNVCKSEMTTLQAAYELLGEEKLSVVSIHAGDDVEDIGAIMKLNNITYPVLMDIHLELGHWGVPILPTTFLVDPESYIRYRAVGSRVWNSPFMIDFLRGVLDTPSLPATSRPQASWRDSE